MKSHSEDQLNGICTMMIAGLEEITGRQAVNKLLQSIQSQAKPPLVKPTLGAVQASLELLYGGRFGRGLALQAGRCSFNAILRQYGIEMGIFENAYRMQPSPRRIPSGLVKIAQKLVDLGSAPAEISETTTTWVWKNPDCMFAGAKESEKPGCTFLVGILQEYLSWASGGRYYQVSETECARSGDENCVMQISKNPLD